MTDNKKSRDAPVFAGAAAGSAFPVGSRIEISPDSQTLFILTPDKKRRAVTHDIIRRAEILCMGEFPAGEIAARAFAVKYRLELTDGTEAVLTVPADLSEEIEHILF